MLRFLISSTLLLSFTIKGQTCTCYYTSDCEKKTSYLERSITVGGGVAQTCVYKHCTLSGKKDGICSTKSLRINVQESQLVEVGMV